METRQELTPGTRYGLLTYIREVESEYGNRVIWVECDCGTVKKVQLSNVMAGSIHTCGRNECRIKMRRILESEIKQLKETVRKTGADLTNEKKNYGQARLDEITEMERCLIENKTSEYLFTKGLTDLHYTTRVYLRPKLGIFINENDKMNGVKF